MGILGIENRTENWKTAYEFARFFRDAELRLKLAQRLEPSTTGEVKLDLFWHGTRDYLDQVQGVTPQDLADEYNRLFGPEGQIDLRRRVEEFKTSYGQAFAELQPQSYFAGPGHVRLLYDNLSHTEVDIVLEADNHLFIGEAKVESRLGAEGSDVLVHQLMRQYVMASILLAQRGITKGVVPFVVWCRTRDQRKPAQVEFMEQQGWLNEENILSWTDIEAISNREDTP